MTIAIFLLKRLAAMAVLLVIVSFLVFSLLWLSPGSVLATLVGTRPASPEMIAALTAEYRLDDSFIVQYWHWLVNAAQLDFGRSIQSGDSVTSLVGGRLALSIELAAFTIVLVVAFGVPAGVVAGRRRGSAVDRGLSLLMIAGMSAPAFAVGILVLYVFGVALGWFPVYGGGSGLLDRLHHLVLPAVSFAAFLGAVVARQTRAATLDVMQQDYITFARARGLGRGRILVRYALRNTALPVVTTVGLLLVAALSGALFIENVFSLEGVGALMYRSVTSTDIPVVQGLAMFAAVFVMVVNLLVDLLAMVIDPRTRYAAGGD